MIFEVAHQMGLLPLLWIAFIHGRGRPIDVAWWWLAGAFAVSWLADTAAHYIDPWMIGAVYPVSQSAIIGAVFLFRTQAIELVIALLLVGALDVYAFGTDSPDILLRTVAWLSVVGIVYPLVQLGRLRISLLVYFGIGWFCWLLYAIDPGWPSWGTYQVVRLAGILLFCWAATSPLPQLKLLRST